MHAIECFPSPAGATEIYLKFCRPVRGLESFWGWTAYPGLKPLGYCLTPSRRAKEAERPSLLARHTSHSMSGGHLLIEVGQHVGPGFLVLVPRFGVWKASVSQTQRRSCAARRQFDRDDGLGPLRAPSPRDPRQLDEPIRLEAQKAAVVRVALAVEVRLEEKGDVDAWRHQQSPRRCKPPVELLRP